MPLLIPLAAIPEIIVAAVIAFLLYWGARQLLLPFLRGALEAIPIVGAKAAQLVTDLFNRVDQLQRSWWDGAIRPMVGLLYTMPRKLDLWMYDVEAVLRKMGAALAQVASVTARVTGLEALYNTIQVVIQRLDVDADAIRTLQAQPHLSNDQVRSIADQVTAQAVDALTRELQDALHTAESYAQTEAAKAAAIGKAAQASVNTLAIQVGKLANALQALTQQVGNLTPALVDSELAHTLAGAEAYTAKARAALDTEITGALSTSEQYAHNLVTTLDSAVNQALEQIDHGIANTRATLAANIQQVATAAHDYTTELTGSLQDQVTELAAAETATAAATKAVTDAFVAYREGCGDPICNWYKPQMQEMQGLSDVLSMAGLFGWVIAAVTDPQGTATEARSMFEPLAQDVQSELVAAIGR